MERSERSVRLIPRSTTPLITRPADISAFDDVWPLVARRLTAMLRRHGASPHVCEDVVQETATRVLTSAVEYRDAPDLSRWAATVARRVYIDMYRKDKRLDDGPLPERIAATDVHATIEDRLALSAVTRAFGQLSTSD